MALWAKVQTLPSPAMQKVHQMYGDHFPVEVRYILASWLEDRVGGTMVEVDPDNPAHEQYIGQFVASLIQELETKANSMVNEDPYLIRIKLLNAAQNFRNRYTLDPLSLYRFLRHCLNMETNLVDQAEKMQVQTVHGTMPPQNSMMFEDSSQIVEKLNHIKQATMETGDILRRMEQEQEAFALKCHDRQKLEGIWRLHRMQTPQTTVQNQSLEKNFEEQKNRLEFELKQRTQTLMQLKTDLEDKITATVSELSLLQSRVLDEELTRWKREQQLAGNGATLNNNLDTLQSWCEDLAELIWHNRHQLKEADRLKQNIPVMPQTQGRVIVDRIPNLQEKVTQLLSSLVTSTFIVEKQPPQVMKTNTRFTSTVRLLVGGRLNVHMTPPQVKVAIISEAQANALLRQDKADKPCETSGEILNNTGTMEYHQGTRHLSVHFRNMQLKRIKRAEKKGTESVMDEKFCLHFQCQFTVGEKELIFKIWTLSLPVVVIVHGNQEPHAWATVTWDNAFGEPGRMPFQVPERVSWFRVAQALNVKFKSMTGRAINEDGMRFLAEKAFRTPNHGEHLSWSQFCKEPLPDRNFTFWEWFYAVMKLTREHLRGPWVDGSIHGFLGRVQAEELMSTCVCGTFLLRFSDSELGGITIAWVHSDQTVFSLAPFGPKDLSTRSLADRINDIGHLMFLYPDIPKSNAFGKYYTPLQETPPTNKGYVKPQLKTHIPGLGDENVGGMNSPYGAGTSSIPGTPHTYYNAQSPDIHNANEPLARTGDERHNTRNSQSDILDNIDSSKSRLHVPLSNSDKVWTSLAAGAFAGALAKTTIAPLDRTKIYFQTSAKVVYSARSAYQFLAKSYKSDGFFALWRGNSATMARIIPYASVQFTAHEQWKQILQVDHNVHHGNKEEMLRFLSGALAGITAQSLTYPLDMTRARLAISSKAKYRTLRETFVKIYKQEGIFTLYRGYTATMMGVIPYAGMSFYVYETLKRKWAEMGHPMTPLSRLCFGAMAGVLGQTSSYPLDIVRRRLQVTEKTKGQPTGIIHMLFTVAREEGVVKGLYKGLSMNWVKGPVAAGISFSVFDMTQTFLRSYITQT